MKKELLSSIENIEIYPIISLLIFVTFFIGMFIWVINVDKKYVDHMKEMPFNDEPQNIDGYEKV
ncbi:cbb3-type cytochrome c oxidase subunit 3 [Aquiflexum sp. TKW24L]|uniref:cbb3-type cytochrome c oxidase subunit 3 n=1 Tax=Aquiflexum sp. TKW24L TaxID=2942212 RepID=UPI0020BE70FE|nr:cbb3-type cytochrome c oxidase subunit 3 [Aquiflexum sp. TKW24L]MCL6259706.1 cbb3-type cytochrome c oxidase subunit 3 [Aquiflexum sp. TKW24L]